MDFITFITEPLQFAFMQRALLALLLISLLSGAMGAYVVTRGMAFLGDALAHSVLPGVAVVYMSGGAGAQGSLLLGGLAASVAAAIGIGFLTRGRRLREDTAIGIVFAGMLALGIGLISSTRSFATDLQHALIGNILAVSAADLNLMALIGAIVLLLVLLFYKELLIVSFDPTLAQTLRLPGEALRLLLLVLLAVTIVIGVQAVGIALISATIVTPAAAARLWVQRLHHLMLLASTLAALCSVGGMYAAWYLNVAPSASIVLLMTLVFLLSFLFAPGKGYLWSLLGRSAQRA